MNKTVMKIICNFEGLLTYCMVSAAVVIITKFIYEKLGFFLLSDPMLQKRIHTKLVT